MSTTRKLTLSAMVSALCFVFLLCASLIPGMCLSLTALAGLLVAAVVMTGGILWALGTWAVVSALGFLLLPSKAPAALFLCFFGHYPVWKSLIEGWEQKSCRRIPAWGMKLLGTAICLALMYIVFRALLFDAQAPILFYSDKTWMMGLFFFALMLAFVAYDYAFTKLIGFFRFKILPLIQKRS